MKRRSDITLPAITLPRVSEKLEAVAADLARFAMEFGIADNADFAPRLATFGFANGVLLGLEDSAAASQFEDLLISDKIPACAEVKNLGCAFTAAFTGEPNWIHEVREFLTTRWQNSADCSTSEGMRLQLGLRILHGMRAGLIVAREQPIVAAKIHEKCRIDLIGVEHAFLADRLNVWRANNWKSYASPFIEFAAAHYSLGSVKRKIMLESISRIYSVAKDLDNPWDFSFWAQTGWNNGRAFAKSHPKDLQLFLEEARPDTLRAYHSTYHRYVLGTAHEDGTVQIERACLLHMGESDDPGIARIYCTGREPRRLARATYDFTFWMGIFAAFPLPKPMKRRTS